MTDLSPIDLILRGMTDAESDSRKPYYIPSIVMEDLTMSDKPQSGIDVDEDGNICMWEIGGAAAEYITTIWRDGVILDVIRHPQVQADWWPHHVRERMVTASEKAELMNISDRARAWPNT